MSKPKEVRKMGDTAHETTILKGFKILVTDDEPDMRTFLAVLLEDNGAQVFKAADGLEALKIAQEEKPDLLTLDLAMPKMDGGEVYKALKAEDSLRDIPVCVITGQPELRKLIYSQDLPRPEGYLNKPVKEEAVLQNIRKILKIGKQ